MKRIVLFFAVVAATLLMAAMAMAQEIPELRGTWRGPTKIQKLDRVVNGKCAIVINVQNGNTFTGYKLYFKKKVLQKEKFVGLYENGRLYLAENKNEAGHGYLTGKQTMVLNYIDHSASPQVQTCSLERVRFSTGFVEIDRDGDTMVIAAEVSHFYPLNAERIIKEADTNKDGKLTKAEWEKWKTKNNWQ